VTDPIRILIIEDSDDDAVLMLRTLTRSGFEPTWERVQTAEEMRTALDKNTFDAIISDYQLPAFNAPQALEIARHSGLDLPFIVVSGNIGEETAVQMMRAGAHDYIMKGNLSRLPEAIRRELRDAEVRAERRKTELALQASQEQIQTRLNQLTVLHDIDLAITSFSDLDRIVRPILTHITELAGLDAAVLLMPKQNTSGLSIIAQAGILKNDFPTSGKNWEEIISQLSFNENRGFFLADLTKNTLDIPVLTRHSFKSCAVLPLNAKEIVRGILLILSSQSGLFDDGWQDFLHSLAMQTAIAVENADLFSRMQLANTELTTAYEATIEGWSRALELRDKETKGHTERVTGWSLLLAQEVGMSESELVHFKRGVLLHDIGKMGIPDSILLKPGPLSDEEWVIMRQHPMYAYQLLLPIPFLRKALDIPFCHHEKWDGSGYPRGLKGEEIPLGARLFALTDVWDALTSNRPYRPAWPPSAAYRFISEQSGRHFDPQATQIFLRLVDQGALTPMKK
jgi:response regulator RpfG family c-di-GMP phosphodiesterase